MVCEQKQNIRTGPQFCRTEAWRGTDRADVQRQDEDDEEAQVPRQQRAEQNHALLPPEVSIAVQQEERQEEDQDDLHAERRTTHHATVMSETPQTPVEQNGHMTNPHASPVQTTMRKVEETKRGEEEENVASSGESETCTFVPPLFSPVLLQNMQVLCSGHQFYTPVHASLLHTSGCVSVF